jgi:hypothetical protein
MKVKLILISGEANSQAVSDALVRIEDHINASIADVTAIWVDQLNLVLCSISDEPAENIQFAANFVGRKRLGGIRTFGIVVPVSQTEFAQNQAREVVSGFLECAERGLLDAARKMPDDLPTDAIRKALRAKVS